MVLFFGFMFAMAARAFWLSPPRPAFWLSDTFAFMAPREKLAVWISASLCLLLAGLPCGAVIALWRSSRKTNAVRIRFRTDGLTATLKDGTTVQLPWHLLTSIDAGIASLLLRFGTDGTLRFLPAQRAGILHPVLAVIRENVLNLGRTPAAQNALSKGEMIRIGIYCLGAVIVGSLLIYLLPPDARRMVDPEPFVLLLCSFAVFWGLMLVGVYLPGRIVRKCSRWQRRRRRRLAGMQKPVGSP